MNRLMLVLHFIMLGILPGMARQQYGVSIPALQRLLDKSTTDTGKIRLSLAIAEAYIRLPGAEQKDMDSASLYMKQAAILNTRAGIPRWEARNYYLQAKAYREKDLYVEGKAAAVKAREY
ncbi:hypothetical protein [Chitinophaga pinensis]|uniref:Tetratricopeptide repeat protein n=1 Tax=Chitinophaga pinensis TaxID=79329 RepID=A0A5C6LQY2_9BACT|nr:hypothetical protein [Chitinophaga pinensis]TWV96195.1 hypothetical protein FEF09_23705 [Chitinophaga pinensis]